MESPNIYPEYHIRIDTDLPDKDIVSFFSDVKLYGEAQFNRYIVCREAKSDGTIHIHACIGLVVSRNTIRDRLKKYFKTLKTSDYSISKRRKKSLEAYVLKDGDLIVSGGYTDEQIERYKGESFSKGKAKVKSSTMMGKLVVGMHAHWVDTLNKQTEPETADYARYIYNHYIDEYRIVPSDFKMKDMVWTLKALYTREYYALSNYTLLVEYKIKSIFGFEYEVET